MRGGCEDALAELVEDLDEAFASMRTLVSENEGE